MVNEVAFEYGVWGAVTKTKQPQLRLPELVAKGLRGKVWYCRPSMCKLIG